MNKISSISAKYSLGKFKELYERTLKLPRKLMSDEDVLKDFNGTKEEKETIKQKRYKLIFDSQEICLETRSLIKLVFGKDNEYFTWINSISFTNDKNSQFVVVSSNYGSENNYWSNAFQGLISLLSNIISEEEERMKYEESLIDKNAPVKYVVSGVLFIIMMLTTWTISNETLSLLFDSTKVLPTRISISLFFSCLLAIIPFRSHWKEFLFSGVLAVIFALLGFIILKSN